MDDGGIARMIDALRIEHRDLDDALAALAAMPARDDMQIARLKRRKLRLKDEITQLGDDMIPDITA